MLARASPSPPAPLPSGERGESQAGNHPRSASPSPLSPLGRGGLEGPLGATAASLRRGGGFLLLAVVLGPQDGFGLHQLAEAVADEPPALRVGGGLQADDLLGGQLDDLLLVLDARVVLGVPEH